MSEQEPRRVIEAEVVREGPSREISEHVTARRIPGGAFFTRSVFSNPKDLAATKRKLRDLKLRLWLWLFGFAAIAGACVYGAFVTETVIWAAFLIVAALGCAIASSVVWLVIWAVARIKLP
jgi:hypothetical protein